VTRDDDILWLDEHAEISLAELAALARLPEADVLELVEYGVLVPARDDVFAAYSVAVARRARRLRADFELDLHGAALALELIERIRELEAEVRALRAQLPRARR
jgi:chaperone modulatory protein CbpM